MTIVPVAVPAAGRTAAAMPGWFELALRRVRAKVSSASGTASAWTRTLTCAEAAPAAIVPVTGSGRAGAPAKSAPSAAFAPLPVISAVKVTAPSVPLLRSTVKVSTVSPVSPSARLTASEFAEKATSWVKPWGRAA